PQFILLVPPRTPRPTLSPYTTPFRSERDAEGGHQGRGRRAAGPALGLPLALAPEVEVAGGNEALRAGPGARGEPGEAEPRGRHQDRKSTRLNSSHVKISYAVFCL